MPPITHSIHPPNAGVGAGPHEGRANTPTAGIEPPTPDSTSRRPCTPPTHHPTGRGIGTSPHEGWANTPMAGAQHTPRSTANAQTVPGDHVTPKAREVGGRYQPPRGMGQHTSPPSPQICKRSEEGDGGGGGRGIYRPLRTLRTHPPATLLGGRGWGAATPTGVGRGSKLVDPQLSTPDITLTRITGPPTDTHGSDGEEEEGEGTPEP